MVLSLLLVHQNGPIDITLPPVLQTTVSMPLITTSIWQSECTHKSTTYMSKVGAVHNCCSKETYSLLTATVVGFISNWHKLESFWKCKLQLRECLHKNDQCTNLKCILLIDCWCGRSQPTIEGATPEMIVLGYIRKQAEHTIRNKQIKSISSRVFAFSFQT